VQSTQAADYIESAGRIPENDNRYQGPRSQR